MQKWTIENNWFHEIDTMWPWISSWLEVQRILYEWEAEYQDISIFESKSYGNVLVLDGVIQITEKDEYTYQEMLAHTPINITKNPQKALIIWWGDGGILRELLKYPSIQQVTLCEIDKDVIELSQTFLPTISTGFSDPRTNVVIGDGAKFVAETSELYDVIIVDSSDPIGPAEWLFVEKFYKSLNRILSPNWAMAIQGESLYLHNTLAKELKNTMKKLFRYSMYSNVQVPTYPAWSIGLLISSNVCSPNFPISSPPENIQQSLKYYSPDMHRASFVLPYGLRKL